MLGYLSGVIKEKNSNELILSIGSESTGYVGYCVKTPDHPRYEAFHPQARVEFYVYSHVREDAFDLYGFINRSEKNLFTTLMSVSGVGPKLALGLLSAVEPSSLIQMIIESDKEGLTGISGVGKKTAERMILELQDVLKKKIEDQSLIMNNPRGHVTSGVDRSNALFIESYLALQGLGYKEAQAKMMIERALLDQTVKKVEDVVRVALKATI